MLVNTAGSFYARRDRMNFSNIGFPSNGLQRARIRGLHADFQLHQARPHGGKEGNLFLSQQIRPYLKVKIRLSPVMLLYKLPYLQGPAAAAVKCPVHKFDLGNPRVQKPRKLPFHQIHVAQADPAVNG